MKKLFSYFFLIFLAFPALAIETAAKQAIVIDDATNSVLFEKNADEKMHPSSMSKLMTVYIVFSRLKEGSLKLTDTLPVTEKAWRLQGSKSFVELGNRISIDDLLKGIIIQSGNDACMVIAEGLAGSEKGFAEQMNDTAKKLGLTNSHFTNPHGLTDPNHLMSARDLATLGQHIIHDFPEYYHYFSEKEFEYHGIKQGNRNLLLYKDDLGVDGLKTGHTDDGGFGIVVSAKQNGRREIVVVNGLSNEKERAEEAERLLAFAFRDFDNVTMVHKGDVIEKAPVWFGERDDVSITVPKDLILTLPKTGRDKLTFKLSYNEYVPAPIKQGDHIADLEISSPNAPAQTVPLVAGESVDELHGIHRAWRALIYDLAGK